MRAGSIAQRSRAGERCAVSVDASPEGFTGAEGCVYGLAGRGGNASTQGRIGGQYSVLAVAVHSWWRHQRGEAFDELQR